MDFLTFFSEHIGPLLLWLSKLEINVTAIQLIQAAGTCVAACVSMYGAYKAWKYAEKRLGRRLDEFLNNEEEKIKEARLAIREAREGRSPAARSLPTIFSNDELQNALKLICKGRSDRAKDMLDEALARSQERADLALAKCELHTKQLAMIHHLLGAIADEQGETQEALYHFKRALDADPNDVDALEYAGFQFVKQGNPAQALIEFGKLEEIARLTNEPLLLAQALRNIGMAYEAPPLFSHANAVSYYRWAVEAFPKDGPPLEFAKLHECRGLANIRAENTNQATRSLIAALAGYEALVRRNGDVGVAAKEGRDRVTRALRRLQQLQNSPNGAIGSVSAALTEFAQLPVLSGLLRQQQPAQQSPDGERPN